MDTLSVTEPRAPDKTYPPIETRPEVAAYRAAHRGIPQSYSDTEVAALMSEDVERKRNRAARRRTRRPRTTRTGPRIIPESARAHGQRQVRNQAPAWLKNVGEGLPLTASLRLRLKDWPKNYTAPAHARMALIRGCVEAGWSDEAIAHEVHRYPKLDTNKRARAEPLPEAKLYRDIAKAREFSEAEPGARRELAEIAALDDSPVLAAFVAVGRRANVTIDIGMSVQRLADELEMSRRAVADEMDRLGIMKRTKGNSFGRGRVSTWDLSLPVMRLTLAHPHGGGLRRASKPTLGKPTCAADGCCNLLAPSRLKPRRFCSDACGKRARRDVARRGRSVEARAELLRQVDVPQRGGSSP